jgi:hypothetical protein
MPPFSASHGHGGSRDPPGQWPQVRTPVSGSVGDRVPGRSWGSWVLRVRSEGCFKNQPTVLQVSAGFACSSRVHPSRSWPMSSPVEVECCIICLDSDPPPIQSGCACRSDTGLAHVDCLIQKAVSQQAHRGFTVRFPPGGKIPPDARFGPPVANGNLKPRSGNGESESRPVSPLKSAGNVDRDGAFAPLAMDFGPWHARHLECTVGRPEARGGVH